jgi:hypothetical protein
MAWKEVSSMSQREEFVVLASVEGANLSELCRRFGVDAQSDYFKASSKAMLPADRLGKRPP